MKKIDNALFHRLIQEARDSTRKRAHYNLHPALDDPFHRLCVGFEPGTYLRPHYHADKWEMFILLRGTASLLLFDASGTVTERIDLAQNGETAGFEIPPQVYHSMVITTPGTVMMEIKPGPYKKLDEHDFASWAPKEKAAEAEAFERWMRTVSVGENNKS